MAACVIVVFLATFSMFGYVSSRFAGSGFRADAPWSLVDGAMPFVLWIFVELVGVTAIVTVLTVGWVSFVDIVPPLLRHSLRDPAPFLASVQTILLISYGGAVRLLCVAFSIQQLKLLRGSEASTWGLSKAGIAPGAMAGLFALVALVPGWIAMTLCWGALLEAVGNPAPQEVVQTLQSAIVSGDWITISILSVTAVVIAPLFEEVLFRGILLRALIGGGLPTAAAVVSSAALFALIHASVSAFVPLFLLGCVLGVLFLRTANLWASIFLHASFNASSIVVMALFS